jgi:hypothetical protein
MVRPNCAFAFLLAGLLWVVIFVVAALVVAALTRS